MSELNALAERLDTAASYNDIFPDADSVRVVYVKLSRVVHPDKYLTRNGVDYKTATKAFQQLGKFYADAQQAITEDRFGKPVVTSKRGIYKVRRRFGDGDIATLYLTETSTTKHGDVPGLMKVARSARDNDLMDVEAAALKKLHSVADNLTRHYPLLLDSFVYKEGRRKANVVAYQPDSYNLAELRDVAPQVGDPKHVAWIWRRLLMALGFAHAQGVLHGAVLPPHILILPEDHGVMLVDWCYSVTAESNQAVKAVVATYRDWYPEEVVKKQPPSPATDIALAARTMVWLLGGTIVGGSGILPDTVPRKMRAYFKGCLQTRQSMRPDSAWELLDEFDALLKSLGEPYYPRKFVELVVPK